MNTGKVAVLNPSEKSLYRQQLEDGFRSLLFNPKLEKDYRADRKGRNARQFRLILIVLSSFVSIFLAADYFLFTPGFSNFLILPRALITQCLVLMLIISTLSPWLEKYQSTLGVVLGLQMGVITLIGNSVIGGREGLEAVATTYIATTYFMYFCFGLRFWLAVSVSGALYISYISLLVLNSAGLAQVVYPVLMISFSNLVGIFGLYNIESNQRKSYLLENDYKYHADHDYLTGLINRKAFKEHVNQPCEIIMVSMILVVIFQQITFTLITLNII